MAPSLPTLALPLALLLGAFAAMPAHATASLTCSVADRNLSLELLGNIGSGHGAALQVTGGEIKLKAIPGKAQAATFEVAPGDVAQQWTFGKDLRIGLSPKKVGEQSIYLAIIAERVKGSEELDRYRGSYVLVLSGPKGETELKGQIKSCDAG
jgi:hypothetical protein